jgi:hypothetical protein
MSRKCLISEKVIIHNGLGSTYRAQIGTNELVESSLTIEFFVKKPTMPELLPAVHVAKFKNVKLRKTSYLGSSFGLTCLKSLSLLANIN